jgi:hypothetical protein
MNTKQKTANPNVHTKQKMLSTVAQMVGWQTLTSNQVNMMTEEAAVKEYTRTIARGDSPSSCLAAEAHLAGWTTPNTFDTMASRNLKEPKKNGGCSNLKDQVTQVIL